MTALAEGQQQVPHRAWRPVRNDKDLGRLTSDKTNALQFSAEGLGIGEEDGVHAEGGCGFYVGLQVVDVDGVGGIDGEGLKEKLEETRVGFQEAGMAGEKDSAKPLQEIETL